MSERRPRALFISYDGMTDPLGQSQVLPYLAGLSARGYDITLLSCEKEGRYEKEAPLVADICGEAGIDWRPIPFRRRPPVLAPLYNAWRLRRSAEKLHAEKGFELVHCRSYLPGVAGMHLKRQHHVRFLFDMRGFWPDERVDGDLWPQSKLLFRLIYRRVKKLETRLIESADHIVSLTSEGKRELSTWPAYQRSEAPITVIPCCADFDIFPIPTPSAKAHARSSLGIAEDAPVAAYLGSIGTWYMLDEMLDFFSALVERRSDARLLFVTTDEPEPIRAAARRKGIDPDRLLIRPAARRQVAGLMAAADFGLFFIKPAYSKKASSPTKMGEIMAMGLPVVANSGVGDVDEIIQKTGGGILVRSFDREALAEAAEAACRFKTDPSSLRAAALTWFGLEEGIERYDRIYGQLRNHRSSPVPGTRGGA